MKLSADLRLVRLLQLVSPTLPVGAYSYSQGLESAIEAGVVHAAADAEECIGQVLEYSVERMAAPSLLRLIKSWGVRDAAAVARWNDLFLASRETAELRTETLQWITRSKDCSWNWRDRMKKRARLLIAWKRWRFPQPSRLPWRNGTYQRSRPWSPICGHGWKAR